MATARTSLPGNRGGVTGFTLLELVIVLLLLGLASAVIAPSFLGGMGGLQLETSARDLVTLMKYARSQAIGRQEVFRIVLGQDDHGVPGYAFTNDFGEVIKDFRLPQGCAYQWPDAVEGPLVVSFYPNGRSSGGEFGVRGAKGRTIEIEVDTITGLARVKRQPRHGAGR